jgi:ribose transport system substrate-binding protein
MNGPTLINRQWRPGRRDIIRLAAGSMGAGLIDGFHGAAADAAAGQPVRRPNRSLRAAFSNIGLQVTWCAQGKQAAEFWGRLFNVEVTWFDGELSTSTQLAAIDEMASGDWDFVAIQANEIDTLAAPVRRMIDSGIPVIDMDTLIAPLDQIDVHTFLAPDNEFMGTAVTSALVNAIGGTGTIIMTQGALGHTGAQGRARGFESVIARHPNVEVLATDAADWETATVVQLWESYLDKYPHISAAFFHNDDMALAALEVMRARNRTETLIGGVDGMPPAIQAVLDGRMYATVRNSSCRIHGGAIVAGVEAALAPKKTPAAPPRHIVIDGPIITPANAPGLLWMEDHFLI